MSGTWVLVAPDRGRRPGGWHRDVAARGPVPEFDPACPFCPGNEHLLPGIVAETASDAPPGWRTRVVPNKYPALRSQGGNAPRATHAGHVRAARGYHEVIVETPRHDVHLTGLAETHLAAVIEAYHQRFAELGARAAMQSVSVFRNHGSRAGASLAHPHSQVIAVDTMPPRLAAASARARAHHARHGRCLVCEQLEREIEEGMRIVETTDDFVTVVPFAARSPYELWIVPRRHQATFARSDAAALAGLGRALQRALRRLASALADPSYNFAIESEIEREADAASMHWGLRIVPDLVTPGGFELATSLPINPSLPEDDAEALRAASAGEGGA